MKIWQIEENWSCLDRTLWRRLDIKLWTRVMTVRIEKRDNVTIEKRDSGKHSKGTSCNTGYKTWRKKRKQRCLNC